MKKKLRSLYVRLILSTGYRKFWRVLAEMGRLARFRRHVVQVFLQLDDPYSYLLSHYLQFVAANYKVELRIYLSQALRSEFMPQPAMLSEYAARDCQQLATELGIPFLLPGAGDRAGYPVPR